MGDAFGGPRRPINWVVTGLSGSDWVDGVEEVVGVEWLGSHWFRDGFWVDMWHYETLELPSLSPS
jgi:squalene cyclase